MSGKIVVLKNDVPLLANKITGKARVFGNIDKAKKFVRNLIWVSNKLTPTDFAFIPAV